MLVQKNERQSSYTSSLQALIHISQSYFQAIFYLDYLVFFVLLTPVQRK